MESDSVQKSDLRVNSSPGRTQTDSLHCVSNKTDAEVDEDRTTLGVFVENDLRPPRSRSRQRLIAVQFPHFKSAGGADSLSPFKETFLSWRQIKVPFLAFDY